MKSLVHHGSVMLFSKLMDALFNIYTILAKKHTTITRKKTTQLLMVKFEFLGINLAKTTFFLRLEVPQFHYYNDIISSKVL